MVLGDNCHYFVKQDEGGKDAVVEASSVVVNSIVEGGISIGKESVVSHCHLQVLGPQVYA